MKVYNFNTFKDFFNFYLSQRSTNTVGKKSKTLNELALEMGYNSPATISMIATGERLPSKQFLQKLFIHWKVPSLERQRIALQIELEKLKLKGKTNLDLLDKYSKITPYHKINLNQHKIISDWYILVLKVLISTEQFNENPQWIYKKLRKKVSLSQINKAIELLIENKIIYRDEATQKLKVNYKKTETTHDVPSEAIRSHHRGMMNTAIEAIEEQDLLQRQYNAVTLQFDKSKIAEAKETVLQFVKEFNEKFQNEKSNDLYQLNVQLFELTNGDI